MGQEYAPKIENKEKPKFLYHGSDTPGIGELEPRKIYTPGGNRDVPLSVYASDNPAFAVSHSFSWSSREGFDVYEKNGKMILEVPKNFRDRLIQKVYLYKVSGEQFVLAEDEETGSTYRSLEGVKPLDVQEFNSVQEAFEHFGGEIVFI